MKQMKQSVHRDPAITDASVLLVEYPAASGNPAARDLVRNAAWGLSGLSMQMLGAQGQP
jgi:hypothetical protein